MAQQSSRLIVQKQLPALPEQCFLLTLLYQRRLPPDAVHVNLTVLMLWGNGSEEPLMADFGAGGRQGEIMNRNWAASYSIAIRREAFVFGISILPNELSLVACEKKR